MLRKLTLELSCFPAQNLDHILNVISIITYESIECPHIQIKSKDR